jgi:hypothetical protein
MYVKEVMSQELYEINPKKQCFSKLDLKPEELCKVVSLHYVVGPPTLVSLKLGKSWGIWQRREMFLLENILLIQPLKSQKCFYPKYK